MYNVAKPFIVRSMHGFPPNPENFIFPAVTAVGTEKIGVRVVGVVKLLRHEIFEELFTILPKTWSVVKTCESDESYQTIGSKSFGVKLGKGFTFGKTLGGFVSDNKNPHFSAKYNKTRLL